MRPYAGTHNVSPIVAACLLRHGCRHPAAKAAQSLLSAVMPGVMEPQRPLATVRLPAKGQGAICAVVQEVVGQDGGDDASPGLGVAGGAVAETRLAVATGEGYLYSFRLELPEPEGPEHGGTLRHSLEGEWNLRPSR